ncbi:DNA-directed RNA polymerase core subunit RPC19 [Sporobolomyces salmoneus]|uniref:DNA-directed RNA polymerase core subunit RPC19 n=1 Tax=Sporobolomyces salmoneus TaxID=183962 RepID=UPI00316D2042
MSTRHEIAVVTGDKVSILPGATEGLNQATYCILEEDHTIGNLLRWMLMKNPAVEFCGYSAPHPSEAKIHIRIQMYDGKSSLDALNEALDNIEQMTETILEQYTASLAAGDFARVEEPSYDFEAVNERLWAEKESQGKGSWEEWKEAQKKKEEEEAAAEQPKLKGAKAVKSGR